MPFKIFTIHILESAAGTAELNQFLNSHRIIEVKSSAMVVRENGYWSFSIQYTEGEAPARNNLKFPEKVDYKQSLSSEVFSRFSQFRVIRKQIALEEGIPAFAIFTDAELAEMATPEKLTLEITKAIKGIGEKKIVKYAPKFILE